MNLFRISLVCACLLLQKPFLRAQDSRTPFRIKTTLHYGFIIPHTTGMKNLIKAHVPAWEGSLEWPSDGSKAWQRIYRNPCWGLSWYYVNLMNPGETGIATGIYPFMNFPLVKKTHFVFQYRLGWGVGYLSKRFDRVENHKNIVIGSHINAIIGMRLEAEWQMSEQMYAHCGLALTHFSNGAYKMPNLGFNIPTLSAGLSRQFGTGIIRGGELPVVEKSRYLQLILAAGLKEIYPSGGRKYFASSYSIEGVQTLSLKSCLAASLDVFYNSSLIERLSTSSDRVLPLSVVQAGISISYRALISKVQIIVSNGIYLYSLYKKDGDLYHRIGMRYAISRRCFASICLKTHFFRADYIETGLGYRLSK